MNISALTVLSYVSYMLGHSFKCMAWFMRNLMKDRGWGAIDLLLLPQVVKGINCHLSFW